MNNSYLGGRLALSSIESKLNTIIKGGYVAVSGMIYSCWDRMLRRLYGPREILDRHLIGLSYYYQGAWHLALIKHVNKRSRVMSVKGYYELVDRDPIVMDMTNIVKLVLGPAEDCCGQDIYPKDMGFSSLSFEVLSEDYSSAQIVLVKAEESIREKLGNV